MHASNEYDRNYLHRKSLSRDKQEQDEPNNVHVTKCIPNIHSYIKFLKHKSCKMERQRKK